MALQSGYNFVRASGLLAFQDSFRARYPEEIQPCELSIVQFLRLAARKEPLPHKCCIVRGIDSLLAGADDMETVGEYVHRLLTEAANHLMNKGHFLYFVLEGGTTFNPGRTLELRTSEGKYLPLAPVFGRLQFVGADHYHGDFNISS